VHIVGPAARYPLDARRNYTPQACSLAQYRQLMGLCGIDRAVLVQPSFYGIDNRALLDTLREGGAAFRGVVVLAADAGDRDIAAMHTLGVRGLRLNLVNPQMVSMDDAVALCARVAVHGWHLQLQLRADEAGAQLLADIADRTELPLVIDHFGRPPLLQPPPILLGLLASGRAYVKLSAPYRLAATPGDDLLPLVRAYAQANPERLLWASDWPHTELFDAPMPDDAYLVDLLARWLPDAAFRHQVCAHNPARLYGYPPAPAPSTTPSPDRTSP
jgi:predicted TIM-barrel fold metal-dependent hydrolase